jgi:general secretion pathway protein B
MSFILDALKKSENDRQRQSAPALFEVKVAQPRRRYPLWAIGLAVLLGVNFVVLAWVLMREPAPAAPPPVAAAQNPATAAPGMGPNVIYVPAVIMPQSSAGQPTPATQPQIAPATVPADEPLLMDDEPAVPPDFDANDYVPAVTRAEATEAAVRRSGFLPSRDEVLSKGTQLPDLKLDLHVFAQNPSERFVFINMRKLREGESLPEGVRVDAITPRGADLSYRGTRFSIDQ